MNYHYFLLIIRILFLPLSDLTTKVEATIINNPPSHRDAEVVSSKMANPIKTDHTSFKKSRGSRKESSPLLRALFSSVCARVPEIAMNKITRNWFVFNI